MTSNQGMAPLQPLSNAELRSVLYTLAAKIAQRRGIPDPLDWPGWNRYTRTVRRAAMDAYDTHDRQLSDWAYELAKIIQRIP